MTVKNYNEDSKESVDFETILSRDVGRLSPLQLRVLLLCALSSMMAALSTNEYVFTTGRITSRCLISECEGFETVEFEPEWLPNAVPYTESGFKSCQRFANTSAGRNVDTDFCPAALFDQNTVVTCAQLVYEHKDTAVYDLELGCSEWLRSLLGSARTAGALLSLPLAGAVSDRWGRRTALAIISFNTAFIGVMRYFVNTYIGFIISVFSESFLGAGAILAIAYIFGVEMVPTKYRLITGAVINTFSNLGQIVLALFAWTVPNWRYLTLALYAPQLLTLIYFWICPESVRWSLSKNRFAEAENTLAKMAKSCSKGLSQKTLLDFQQVRKQETELRNDKAEKELWLVTVVFRHKPILWRCIMVPCWWLTNVLTYYGMSVNAVNMSGNQYINYMLVAAASIAGFGSAYFLNVRIGRKRVLTLFYWLCCLCQVAYIFMPKDMFALSLTVYLIGKLSISAAGSTVYVYTSELFPTRYRSRLFGYCSMVGRIGSIIAPLTPALGATIWEGLPFAMFASLAFLSGFLVMLSPETRGRPLPDTMEEACSIGSDCITTEIRRSCN